MNNSFCLIREKRKNESIAKSIFLLCTKITVQHVRYRLQGYGYLMGKARRKISTWPWPTGTHLLHSQKKGGCYKVYCWNPSSLLKVPTWMFDYEVYKKGRGMGNGKLHPSWLGGQCEVFLHELNPEEEKLRIFRPNNSTCQLLPHSF